MFVLSSSYLFQLQIETEGRTRANSAEFKYFLIFGEEKIGKNFASSKFWQWSRKLIF